MQQTLERSDQREFRQGHPPTTGSSRVVWMVLGGIVLTLGGLLGDLVAHLTAHADAHEALISFDDGTNPWHLVLFAGIAMTAAGGILWAVRLRSGLARVAAVASSFLLLATIVVGGLVAAQEDGHDSIAAASHPVHRAAGPAGDSEASSDAATGLGGHRHHGNRGATEGSAGAGAASARSTTHGHDASTAGSEGASHFGAGHEAPGKVTPAEARVLRRQLATAREATAKFGNVLVARASGYVQVTQFIPGLGLHLANLAVSTDRFDPATPQLLLYEPDADGELHLAGVAYALTKTSDVPPEGFAGDSDVWHFHNDLCFLPGGTVTITQTSEECAASSGFFQAETSWLLHAWIWERNPEGVFHEYNPRVT